MTDDIKTKVSEWRPSLYKTAAFILDSDKISSVDKECLDAAICSLNDIAHFKMNSIDKVYLLIQIEGFQERAKRGLAEIEKIRGRESVKD